MTNKENENLDFLNEEIDAESAESADADPETGETTDVAALKQKNEELAAKNRQLFERAKKAEGFEKNAEGHWVKIQKPEADKPKAEVPPQPSEPDYAKLAFLETKGISNPDDQKFVQDEAVRLKMSLTDILGLDYVQSKLANAKDQREAQAGMPKGRGSPGNKSQQDVDYWLAKGETPDDLELANQVIEARIKKEEQKNKFSDVLYTG